MNRFLIATGVALSWIASAVPSTALGSQILRVYELGNSLTADAWQQNGLDSYSAARGNTLVQGRNIRWGMGLATQWNDYLTQCQNPNVTTISGHGFFQEAFANHTWDAITLQPFSNSLADEMDAAKHMVDIARQNPANQHAALYLYAPWPGRDYGTEALTFETKWLEPYTAGPIGNFPSKDYFRQCYDRLKADYPDNPVYFIPTGEVFEELYHRINAGLIPGVSDPQVLYNDGLHASLTYGRYVASVTYYATLLREDPRGLPVPSDYQPNVTPEIAAAFQETIWHVLTSQALRTNVWAPGDVDGNGLVAFEDLLILAQNYRTTTSGEGTDPLPQYTRLEGDLNGDLYVNFADLLTLAQHYESPSAFASDWALAQSMVPEPGLAILGLAVIAHRRRRRTL